MKIEVINVINKEANSITSLKINDQLIPLTEKELIKLITCLVEKREDLFEDEGFITPDEASLLKTKLDSYKQEIMELENRLAYYDDED